MSGPVEIIIIIAAVLYVMISRLMGEPAQAKRMLLVPAVLIVIGLLDVSKAAQSPTSIAFLVGTATVSAAIGLLRGASIRVFVKEDIVYMRYTVTTVFLWVLNFAIRFGASFVLALVDPKAGQAMSNGLMLTLGAGLLVEGLAVLSKAVRVNSRVVWEKGKDGQPDKMSPFVDNLQQKVQNTDLSKSGSRGRRGLFGSLVDDVRDLDFRRPNNGSTPAGDVDRLINTASTNTDEMRVIAPRKRSGEDGGGRR